MEETKYTELQLNSTGTYTSSSKGKFGRHVNCSICGLRWVNWAESELIERGLDRPHNNRDRMWLVTTEVQTTKPLYAKIKCCPEHPKISEKEFDKYWDDYFNQEYWDDPYLTKD